MIFYEFELNSVHTTVRRSWSKKEQYIGEYITTTIITSYNDTMCEYIWDAQDDLIQIQHVNSHAQILPKTMATSLILIIGQSNN